MSDPNTRWNARLKAAKRRLDLRAKAVGYKGGKCEICGYCKCLNALEFHHTNPFEKDFSISDRMTSWEAIQAELEKCSLLCSNCHREVHDGYHSGFLISEEVDRGGRDHWEDSSSDLDELDT